MIRLEGVSKIYRVNDAAGKKADFHALRDVSLNIGKGSIFGVIGRSGAGKSTLIRCINLLERPTEGRVFLDETELSALPEQELRAARRKIGMIFQSFNLPAGDRKSVV